MTGRPVSRKFAVMDDAIVERWRMGDPAARVAVRNRVRALAERVFAHPSLKGAVGPGFSERIRSAEGLRALTAEVSGEVMRQDIATGGRLTALTLLAAGRRVVEGMQEGRPSSEEAHLPPPVAVALALAPDTVAGPVRDAADRHLERCGLCREDLRILRHVMQTLAAADQEARPDRVAREVAGAGEPAAPPAEAAIEAAVASAVEEVRRDPRRLTRPPPRPARPAAPASGRFGWGTVLVALAGAAALGLAWRRGHEGAGGAVEGVAALADRSPPGIRKLDRLPAEVQPAVGDFARGQCRTAAGRFHAAHATHPEVLDLYVLEGASFVCAGDARRALRAFRELDAARGPDGPPEPRQAAWYRAQARLLDGDARGALVDLRQAEVQDARHREQAAEQADRLTALLGS